MWLVSVAVFVNTQSGYVSIAALSFCAAGSVLPCELAMNVELLSKGPRDREGNTT